MGREIQYMCTYKATTHFSEYEIGKNVCLIFG